MRSKVFFCLAFILLFVSFEYQVSHLEKRVAEQEIVQGKTIDVIHKIVGVLRSMKELHVKKKDGREVVEL